MRCPNASTQLQGACQLLLQKAREMTKGFHCVKSPNESFQGGHPHFHGNQYPLERSGVQTIMWTTSSGNTGRKEAERRGEAKEACARVNLHAKERAPPG